MRDERTTQIIVKPNSILIQGLNRPRKRTKRLPIHTMRMARGMHIRPRLVDLAVDRKRRPIDRQLGAAGQDVAALVDQHQVRHADLAKVLGQRVDPKVVRVRRVAQRDVAGHALVEALPREDAEGGGEVLLVVLPGGVGGGKGGRGADDDLAGCVAEEVHFVEELVLCSSGFLRGGGGGASSSSSSTSGSALLL